MADNPRKKKDVPEPTELGPLEVEWIPLPPPSRLEVLQTQIDEIEKDIERYLEEHHPGWKYSSRLYDETAAILGVNEEYQSLLKERDKIMKRQDEEFEGSRKKKDK
jgi:hypothetical protein